MSSGVKSLRKAGAIMRNMSASEVPSYPMARGRRWPKDDHVRLAVWVPLVVRRDAQLALHSLRSCPARFCDHLLLLHVEEALKSLRLEVVQVGVVEDEGHDLRPALVLHEVLVARELNRALNLNERLPLVVIEVLV